MATLYCGKHAPRKQKKHSVIGRFLKKITLNRDKLFEGTPCWEWQAFIDDGGYGRFKGLDESYAHRFAYRFFIGAIPEGFDIDHRCRNRRCQSPFHIQAVTHTINKALAANIKTHCINGHSYDEANTGYTNRSERLCKTCRYQAIKRWRANHSEKAG